MREEIIGTGVALITPFDKTNKIDFPALKKIINNCIKGEVKSLVVLGTTAETPTLSSEEKKSLLDFVREEAANKVTLIAGFGGNNTLEVCEEIARYDLTGYKYILSASPYYNKPSQEGIYQHYRTIVKASPLPIILYNVPGRTSSNIAPETTLRLAREFENIVGIKEASGSIEQCIKILKHKPKDFVILSGDDALVVSQMAIGVEGCISVIANHIPKDFNEMIQACLQGDFKKASNLQLKYDDLIDLIFEEGNPTGIKATLSLSNITTDIVRLPLVKATESLREKIKKSLMQL